VTVTNVPYVNDNLGSPAAADTTLGTYLVGFLGKQQPQRA